MKLRLAPNVSSRQELKTVIIEVEGMSRWFHQNTIKKQMTGTGFSGLPPLSQTSAALLNDWHAGEQVSQQSVDGLLATLNDFAAKAEFVTITLAALPTPKLKQDIVNWFRRNVRSDLLVDFNFDSTMLGGMVIRCGSHILDLSFKRLILENRAKFPEVLRNV